MNDARITGQRRKGSKTVPSQFKTPSHILRSVAGTMICLSSSRSSQAESNQPGLGHPEGYVAELVADDKRKLTKIESNQANLQKASYTLIKENHLRLHVPILLLQTSWPKSQLCRGCWHLKKAEIFSSGDRGGTACSSNQRLNLSGASKGRKNSPVYGRRLRNVKL